ncbi:MAG: peroxiredoxin family protein [Acidobacteriota bacterium]
MAHPSPLIVAPPFELPTQKGELRSLAQFLAKGPVLLAFHRGTWCPNCRRRFTELADHSAAYEARGVQIVAILAQSSDAVRRYIEETGLPFDILVDESRSVLKAYGVWHAVGLVSWNTARPALFLIDRSGAIRYSFIAERQDQFPSPAAIDEALDKMGEG